jgi:Tfp pilus assembly protein PilN
MVNINLTTRETQVRDEMPYKSGIWAVVAAFILLIIVYGGIYFYKASLIQKTAAATTEYASEKQKLMSESNKEVMDFQNRLLIAKGLLAEKNTAGESLGELEKRVVAGAYLTSCELNRQKKSLSLKGLADNFGVVAKQVLNLKQSDYFSEVTVGDSALSGGGKVEFSIDLKIK